MGAQDADGQTQSQENSQGDFQQTQNANDNRTMSPPPSQAETLMSTQDAKERTEARTAAKGKQREAQATGATTTTPVATRVQASMGPPLKPACLKAQAAPIDSPKPSDIASNANTAIADTTTISVNAPVSLNTASGSVTPDVPAVTPQKRGPGRPRRSEQVALPLSKRIRGRTRNTSTPASNTRQRAANERSNQTDNGEDSDYHNSEDSSSESIPLNILTQFNAHVVTLRTRLDLRGIPEQYSLFKSFWVPMRSSYFDGGSFGPPARFVYWDPLFITSVACPVCQQPLAIAAGGGWLDEPLSMRDGDGPCWIIGRRYVCTQCFAATEAAASAPSATATVDVKPTPVKVDFTSPVYYISWEKRFRALLPEALAAEFPTRVRKRVAAVPKANTDGVDVDMDMNAEGEGDMDAGEDIGEDADQTPRRSKRARHCLKCGSKACPGRMGRLRCSNGCYDCGSMECKGRLSGKSNVTCKGETGMNFKDLNTDASSPSETEPSESSATPAFPQSITWPNGLPQVPAGFVLAIPYAVSADGKPATTGPGMAYLVPQGQVPGFLKEGADGTMVEAASVTGPATTSVPALPAAPEPVQLQEKATTTRSKATPKTKRTPQKASVQPQPQALASSPVASSGPAQPPPAHPHPQLYPHPHQHHPLPPHGAPYLPHPGAPCPPHPHPPHPPQAGGPEPGYYNGYYHTYGYPPSYNYGYYPPYPPNSNQPPAPENGSAPPPPVYPQYAPGAYGGHPGYGPPPPGAGGYPPPNSNGYPAPPPGPVHAKGYTGPASGGQPQQYATHQADASRPAPATPATTGTRKRKLAALAGEKSIGKIA